MKHLVSSQDSSGSTPLHIAVYHDSDELTRLLIGQVDQKNLTDYLKTTDKEGNTALHLACELNQDKQLRLMLSNLGFQQRQLLSTIVNNEGCWILDLAEDELSVRWHFMESFWGRFHNNLVIAQKFCLPAVCSKLSLTRFPNLSSKRFLLLKIDITYHCSSQSKMKLG